MLYCVLRCAAFTDARMSVNAAHHNTGYQLKSCDKYAIERR